MADIRFALDPSRIRVSEAEILADLSYPGRSPAAGPQRRPAGQRRQRRRSR